eukprot:COSAG01_NODE_4399_length_5066_cov_18.954500_4_plen_201_part_00
MGVCVPTGITKSNPCRPAGGVAPDPKSSTAAGGHMPVTQVQPSRDTTASPRAQHAQREPTDDTNDHPGIPPHLVHHQTSTPRTELRQFTRHVGVSGAPQASGTFNIKTSAIDDTAYRLCKVSNTSDFSSTLPTPIKWVPLDSGIEREILRRRQTSVSDTTPSGGVSTRDPTEPEPELPTEFTVIGILVNTLLFMFPRICL